MSAAALPPGRARVGREHRREHDRGELGQRRGRQHRPARDRPREHEHRARHQQRHEPVVGVRVGDEQRERERRPRVGEQRAQVRPAQPAAEQPQPAGGQQVERHRGGVRGRQVVPGAAPRQQRLERHVGVVEDRAVGVAALVVEREVAVDGLAGAEVVGADHARVADVDHVRADDVEPAAEAHAGTPRRSRATSAGTVSRTGAALAPARDHQHPHQQVGEQRIDERHRHVDPRRAEERERDREREQHQQVEVQQPPRRARERQHEQHAQRQPDPQRVGEPPERPGVAARHRPGDLVARPALEHAAGAVVDDGLRDLLRVPWPLGAAKNDTCQRCLARLLK